MGSWVKILPTISGLGKNFTYNSRDLREVFTWILNEKQGEIAREQGKTAKFSACGELKAVKQVKRIFKARRRREKFGSKSSTKKAPPLLGKIGQKGGAFLTEIAVMIDQ